MPYALFCQEAKLSNSYPTEADVWEQARQSGLLVDVRSGDDETTQRSIFENDYEIRPCLPDAHDDWAESPVEPRGRSEMAFEFVPSWPGDASGQVIAANASAHGSRSATAWKRAVTMRVLAFARGAWISSKPSFTRPA